MNTKGLTGLLLLLILAGCGTPDTVDPLVGVWLRPIEGQPGTQGFQFEADGTVTFLNTFSMMGDRWQRTEAGQLQISSHTERFPEPRTDTWEIRELTDQVLVLAGQGQAEGAGPRFHRHPADGPINSLVGRWVLADGSFFDITPLGGDFRVVVADSSAMTVCVGKVDGQELKVTGEDREFVLSLVPGSQTGQKELMDSQQCLSIDDQRFVCRY